MAAQDGLHIVRHQLSRTRARCSVALVVLIGLPQEPVPNPNPEPMQEFGELLDLGPMHVRMLAAELMQPPAARLRSAFGSSGPVVQLHTALMDLVGP